MPARASRDRANVTYVDNLNTSAPCPFPQLIRFLSTNLDFLPILWLPFSDFLFGSYRLLPCMFWNYLFSYQKPLEISCPSQDLVNLLMGLERKEASVSEWWVGSRNGGAGDCLSPCELLRDPCNNPRVLGRPFLKVTFLLWHCQELIPENTINFQPSLKAQ